jgi:hypothetical protein
MCAAKGREMPFITQSAGSDKQSRIKNESIKRAGGWEKEIYEAERSRCLAL